MYNLNGDERLICSEQKPNHCKNKKENCCSTEVTLLLLLLLSTRRERQHASKLDPEELLSRTRHINISIPGETERSGRRVIHEANKVRRSLEPCKVGAI